MKIYIKQDFDSFLGQAFSLETPKVNTSFTLQEIKEQKTSSEENQNRQPFSLFFSSPAVNSLGQGNYKLQHKTFGDITVFLVPVEQQGQGEEAQILFQALFN